MLIISAKLLVLYNISYATELTKFLNDKIKSESNTRVVYYKHNNTKILIYNYKNTIEIKKLLNNFLYQKALNAFVNIVCKQEIYKNNKRIKLKFKKINSCV